MNKRELVAKVAAESGLPKAAAAVAVDSVLRSIQKGRSVTLAGVGTVAPSRRKARIPKRRVML